MTDITKLARIQIGVIVLFAILKLIRPSVLDSDSPELLKLCLLSLPNFFEGIIGVLTLTAIGLYLNDKLPKKIIRLTNFFIYVLATVLAGIYVLTQEFKIHNIGGNNVFDQNDVIFSIAGLMVGLAIVIWLWPTVDRNTEMDQ